MTSRPSVQPFRRLTCAVAAIATAAALGACSTDDESSSEAGSSEQTQAAEQAGDTDEGGEGETPDAPLSELILTGDEVPGLNLEPLGPENMMQDLVSQLPDNVEVTPPECKDIANFGSDPEQTPESRVSGYDDNSKLVGVSLSPDVSMAVNTPDLVSKCPQYTVETDLSEFVEEQTANSGYEIPPEAQEMLGPDFGKSTQTNTLSEVQAESPEGVEDFYAFYLEGTESALGQEFPVAKLQIVGVIDGIMVSVTSSPFAVPDPQTGELLGTPADIDKDAYLAKAQEVFNAQVEKIRNA